MGVDFAANASSKAIKESVDLSAAITAVSGVTSAGTTIAADGKSVTFAYNGTTYYYNGTTDGSNNADSLVPNQSTTAANQTLANIGTNGSVQRVTLAPGLYSVVLYGAQGACNRRLTEDVGGGGPTEGGYGGYSEAVLHISTTTTVYVTVGGKGNARAPWKTGYAPFNTKTGGSRTASATTDAKLLRGGGYNGGGNWLANYPSCNEYSGGGGGGATHIALSLQGDGQLKNYEGKKEDVLLVAGGGGGASWVTAASYYGSGGGATAMPNVPSGSYTSYCAGGAGTQSGSSITAGTKVGSRGTATIGTFGQGGNGFGCTDGGGGGGGGWYGGGGGVINGGGGGSGYYSPNTNYITDALLLNGGNNVNAQYTGSDTRYGHKGHGFAKITLIGGGATQTSIPTLTLNRHDSKTFAFAGDSETDSLLGTQPNNLALSAAVTNVYQVNGLADNATQLSLLKRTFTDAEKADASANAWLTYSFTSNGVALKARRYWTGTKPFYVKVKDTNNSESWFKFYASVEGGELKKDKTPKMKNYE